MPTCLMKISRSLLWPKGLYLRLNLSNLMQHKHGTQTKLYKGVTAKCASSYAATDYSYGRDTQACVGATDSH